MRITVSVLAKKQALFTPTGIEHTVDLRLADGEYDVADSEVLLSAMTIAAATLIDTIRDRPVPDIPPQDGPGESEDAPGDSDVIPEPRTAGDAHPDGPDDNES